MSLNDEVESQLSAMFDGQLPAAECELLSRRIDRDENLRARWSRYALIGAAMRSEPVATARSGFALRVSAALAAEAGPHQPPQRGRRLLWTTALAATLVAGVAGLSVSLLRDAALATGAAPMAAAGNRGLKIDSPAGAPAAPTLALASEPEPPAAALAVASHGSPSYVTPPGSSGVATILRSQLADYIVAHSAYSTPLLRRNVLSELMTSEDASGFASSYSGAGGTVPDTAAGGNDVLRSSSGSGR